MADNRMVRRQAGSLTQHELLSNESRIAIALGEMALKRNGEYSPEQQEVFAAGLSKEPFEDVLLIIDKIAESSRRDWETACPDFGTLLVAVRSIRHPLRHLREVVGRLARIFGVTVDEEMLESYQEEAGHRTDEDLDKAYAAIRGDETLKRMPRPAEFRAACGIPKIYRDGSNPE